MKRLLLIFLILFYAPVCHSAMIIQKCSSGGAGCASGDYGNNLTQNSSTVVSGDIMVAKVALGCSGTTTSMSVETSYVNTSAVEMYFLIYADNAGEPGDLIGSAGPYYDGAFAGGPVWATFNAAIAITGDPEYVWMGAQWEYSSSRFYRVSGGSQELRRLGGYSFGAFPSTWDTGSDTVDNSKDYNIYATF